ncbi:sensor histidine kinase [Paenibacillus paeoniae]|uniref:Sensor histidine kinase n=1 Tax=Paenibacillus paeoniae TaxID=2292705 RepID=A0A371PGS0_9BACL|nr:sensor histidine kinase [Paenibacillus paeoniae]REK75167.1 sensor histidine kinase [Paenibacillus paeoniae]
MNIRIRHKLVLFVLIGVLFTSSISLLYVQKTHKLYEQLVYEQTSEKLYLYAERIEDKLAAIDRMTQAIASDIDIQQELEKIKKGTNSSETYYAIKAIEEKLFSYRIFNYTIRSVAIIDYWGNDYWLGTTKDAAAPAYIKQFIDMATEKEGGSLWKGGERDSKIFTSLREIRGLKSMDFPRLGTFIVRVNADDLIDSIGSNPPSSSSNNSLIIYEDHVPIYWNDEQWKQEMMPSSLIQNERSGQRYEMLTLDHHKYLTTLSTMSFTGWTLVNLVPYESLFQKAILMKNVLLLLYTFILVSLIWIGFIFARSITRPLEKLANRMSKVEQGDFVIHRELPAKNMDEIGWLTNNFDKMTASLDRLIKDNYIKQIHIKESQYEALKAKLNPHFLYNTLDSINWLARRNRQERISSMVKALGDMLRSTTSKKEMVMLQEEIQHVDNYLLIQKYRFEERLHCEINIPDELTSCYIPTMILQPIVENAIKYGMDERTGECHITLSGERFGEQLDIWIADQGPGMDTHYLEQDSGDGIGLRSIHERLQLLYGEPYGIAILEGIDQGTIIRIRIPVLLKGEDHHE